MNPLRKAANTNNIPTLSKLLMMNPYPKFINDVDTAGRTALTVNFVLYYIDVLF